MRADVIMDNMIIPVDVADTYEQRRKVIHVSMLRLDLVHPVISGNKIFKLHYFLEDAVNSDHKQLITFGGAYSNHLAATAFACKAAGVRSLAFIRGEKPDKLSHTLALCMKHGMHLEFISRKLYKTIHEKGFLEQVSKQFGEHVLVPEGGFSKKGAKGAELIYNYFDQNQYTHICCAIGTGTTFAGLINAKEKTEIIGFVALKNLDDINERLETLGVSGATKYTLMKGYHFNGYAKKNSQLITFMNSFYQSTKIPLDFVYTGKMMFGVYDLIKKNYFPPGSNVLCIHTGGLQGNESLPKQMLNF